MDFLFFDAGGGHRSAATALQSVIQAQQRPWDVRLVNLNDILLPIDTFKKLTGHGLEDIYNLVLRKGWTLGSPQALKVMHGVIRLYHHKQTPLIEHYWRADPPDMVVSVIPNFNRAIFQGLRRVSASIPYVTILTDLADYPPHFWMERQEQYFICGSEKAVRQAYEMGHAPERVFRASGMILRPHFYDVAPVDRAAELKKLGLDPGTPTALVLFGGLGSPEMERIAASLQRLKQPLQMILMCGRNEKLAAKLRAALGGKPVHIQGFTTEVPRFMRISDFMIGKPGPGSVSEAVQMGLPVVVERNAWTLPQERYNAEWIVENGVGLVLGGFREIGIAVERLLEPGRLDRFRARAAAIENRAVFEIVDILERLLPASGAGSK